MTPEERAGKLASWLGEWLVSGVTDVLDRRFVAEFRAAENEALERAAAVVSEEEGGGGWHFYLASRIRDLKHPETP